MWYPKNIWKSCIVCFFLFSSCVEEHKENNGDKLPPTMGTHQYRLTEASTLKPVDINMDGKYNKDLFQELSYLKKDPIIIDFDRKNIFFFWEEPRINNDRLGILPDRYSDGMLLRFYPTRNFYRYRVLEDGVFQPVQSEEILPDGRTFIVPQYVYFEGRTKLRFSTQQKILTKDEGIQYIAINAVYEYEKEKMK